MHHLRGRVPLLIGKSTKQLNILPRRTLPMWIAQQCRWMIGDNHLDPVIIVNGTAQLTHSGFPVQKGVGGSEPQCKNELRLDQFELLEEIGLTLFDLEPLRCAIAWRTALENVAD